MLMIIFGAGCLLLSVLFHAASLLHLGLPLLYAREGDRAVEVLEEVAEAKENRRLLRDWPQAKQMVYQNKGRKARALFDRANLPHREQAIRNTLKREGLWQR